MSRSQRHKKEIQGITSRDPAGTIPQNIPKMGSGQAAPTNITISPATITAASAIGTVVGTLAAVDAAGGPIVFEVTDTESGHWELFGANTIRKSGAVTAGARAVGVKATDSGGLSYTKSVAITVT